MTFRGRQVIASHANTLMFSEFHSAEDSKLVDETFGSFWLTTPLTRRNHDPSPVTNLPSRTLEKIFLYACNTLILENQMPSLWIHQTRDVVMAPVILSHVCTRWRNIANTTPRLWRNVVVRLSPWNSKYAGELLDDFLLKSDPYTVNLCFFVNGRQAPPSSLNAENCLPSRHGLHPTIYNEGSIQVVHTAVKFSRRWERASFIGSMVGYQELLVHLCHPLYLPNLTSLEIHSDGGFKIDQEPRSLFQHAYTLRNLKFTGLTFLEFILPWIHLRRIHVVKVEDVEILKICAHCPYLEELIIEGAWTNLRQSLTQQINLRNLRVFSLTAFAARNSDNTSTGVMDYLIAPSVLELKICDLRHSDLKHSRSLRSLQQLLFRSSAYDTLHSLDLTFNYIAERDLIDLLRATTSLVTLHINLDPTIAHTSLAASFLANLSDADRMVPFLPQLRKLSCSGMDFVMDKLIIMLRTRSELAPSWDGTLICALKDVRICMPCSLLHLPPSVGITLECLRESGMNITLDEVVMGDC